MKSQPFDLIRHGLLVETGGEDLLAVMRWGTSLGWLPWPILASKL